MVSFRRRIRRSALLLIVALLAAFSALLYTGLSTLLHQQLDARLVALGEAWAEFIGETAPVLPESAPPESPPIGGDQSRTRKDQKQELREIAGTLVVLSPSGKVLWKGAAAWANPPLPAAALDRVLSGDKIYDTIPIAESPPVRRISLPVFRDGKVRYILQIEASLRFIQHTLRQSLALLSLVSICILALAWVGSRWLADEALTPVDVLSSMAERISGYSLKTRVSLDVHYTEFRRLAAVFNAMLERLQRVFEAQRRFIADAAHELKTPLSVIKGNLEVTLKKVRSAEDYRDVLIGNLDQVERLIALTRPLLTLAQFAGETPPVQLAPLAIEPLLKELIADLGLLAEDRGITLTLEACRSPWVLGDEGWLRHLLINLLDNALRHTPAGGTVTVQIGQKGTIAEIAVKDTGTGIAPVHLPHIFERFYRADSARARDSGGTGLGLAIVKEIAEAHHGTIHVESELGKGSVFTLRLPVAMGEGSVSK
ncbi:MAG TPA: ATP-binding protein [Nitrospirales bacterium]